MGYYTKLASAVYNDIVSGLRGYTSNPTMSIELLEDDLAEMRLMVIKEFALKGIIPRNDLLMSINCIPVDCKNIENCSCGLNSSTVTPTMHFEIPLILSDYGVGIEYIGSVDKLVPFIWYTNPNLLKLHKFRKRAWKKPFVFIDLTPNLNNMNDCWLYGAPLIKKVSVVGIFKNIDLLEDYNCCAPVEPNNLNFIDSEVKRRVTDLKIKYYRQLAAPILPNTQMPQ